MAKTNGSAAFRLPSKAPGILSPIPSEPKLSGLTGELQVGTQLPAPAKRSGGYRPGKIPRPFAYENDDPHFMLAY